MSRATIHDLSGRVSKTVTETVSLDLDQELIEEALADWLLSNSKAFYGCSISFDWDGCELPRVTVNGKRITP
jgi:hypothetical protein